MGKLALAAKITHVPSMYLSELDGPQKGCRKEAIDGHKLIGQRCRNLGVRLLQQHVQEGVRGGIRQHGGLGGFTRR